MKNVSRAIVFDIIASIITILLVMFYINVGKVYHGNDAINFNNVITWGYLIVSMVVAICVGRVKKYWLRSAIRMWLIAGLFIAVFVRFWGVISYAYGYISVAVAVIIILAMSVVLILKASESLWDRIRRIIILLPSLVFIMPMVIGYAKSTPMVWLDDGGAKQTKKIATIVLLYDEMNANVSHGIVDVLASNGMKVGTKMVLPVHSATAQVVPAIFSGRSFKIANACGYTRVCSEEAVLDFSQITVNRGDVDVIGFYLPYCEILGLRSCERVVVKRSVFDIKHWRCAVENFLNNTEYGKNNFCQKLHHEAFAEMREKVIGALLDAPALQRGGGVFAHLPLPHPPANMTGTLSEQYKSNVSKAELVLTQVLNKLNENKIEPRILIFSDHPLRPAMWCARESDQFDAPCVVPAELLDDHVPFIVAARSNVPSIAHVQSNQQVFDVLREWLKH